MAFITFALWHKWSQTTWYLTNKHSKQIKIYYSFHDILRKKKQKISDMIWENSNDEQKA